MKRPASAWLQRACMVVVAGAAAGVFIALLLYIVHFYRPLFTSDDAVVNTLAGSMWDQGRLFPRDWINNNGDLMVPSGAVIVAPLLGWLPNGFQAHALTGVFATIFMVGSLIAFLRAVAIPWLVIFLIATIPMAAFSYSFEVMIFEQATYVWWAAGFFASASIVVLVRRRRQLSSTTTWVFAALLALVVFSISLANPGRVLVMMVGPLYVFDRMLALGQRSEVERTARGHWLGLAGLRDPLTIVGIVLAFSVAALVYFLLARTGVTHSSYSAAALRWGGWSSVLRHAKTFEGWFVFIGAPTNMVLPQTFAARGTWLFRWGIAIGLTAVGIVEILRLPRERDCTRRALSAALVAAMLPIAVLYLLFDPLAANPSTMRYFVVPFCIALALTAFPLRSLLESFPNAGSVGVLACSIQLMVMGIERHVPTAFSANADFWALPSSPAMRLAQTLRREGLRWGYATWWNAGVTTVQSDSSIQVVPVIHMKRSIAAFPSMISTRWYRPEAWQGESFLVLSHAETSAGEFGDLLYVFGKPARTIESSDYRILVYDRNISADFGKSTQGPLAVRLGRGDPAPRVVAAQVDSDPGTGARSISVRVRNESAFTIRGTGSYGFSIGRRELDPHGDVVDPQGLRWPLPSTIEPGGEKSFRFPLPANEQQGGFVRVDLVQNAGDWLGDIGIPPIDVSRDVDVIFFDRSSPGLR